MGVVRLRAKVTFAKEEQWAELICQQHDAPVTCNNHVVWQ